MNAPMRILYAKFLVFRREIFRIFLLLRCVLFIGGAPIGNRRLLLDLLHKSIARDKLHGVLLPMHFWQLDLDVTVKDLLFTLLLRLSPAIVRRVRPEAELIIISFFHVLGRSAEKRQSSRLRRGVWRRVEVLGLVLEKVGRHRVLALWLHEVSVRLSVQLAF